MTVRQLKDLFLLDQNGFYLCTLQRALQNPTEINTLQRLIYTLTSRRESNVCTLLCFDNSSWSACTALIFQNAANEEAQNF